MALPHTKTSGSARTAVLYITLGAVMDVWTVLWYVWINRHGTQNDGPYFWCYGFFLTGLTLVIIGLALGRIGQAVARRRHRRIRRIRPSATAATTSSTRRPGPVAGCLLGPTSLPRHPPGVPTAIQVR